MKPSIRGGWNSSFTKELKRKGKLKIHYLGAQRRAVSIQARRMGQTLTGRLRRQKRRNGGYSLFKRARRSGRKGGGGGSRAKTNGSFVV